MTATLDEILDRLKKSGTNRAVFETPAIDPEVAKEAEVLKAELLAKDVPFTEGALIGMAENRVLRRRYDEQAAERFAQVAAIPRRFSKTTLIGFKPLDGVQGKAFKRVCRWACAVRDGKTPWLVLSGSWGTGKSHLACAALNSLRDAKGLDVRFVACIDLVKAVQGTYQDKSSGTSEAQIVADLARIDVLCLDDVAAVPSAFEAKILTQIIDARYRNDLPTLIVTNLGVEETNGKASKFDEYVGDLVASRVHECADIVDCTTTDFRRGLSQRLSELGEAA